MGYSLLQQEQGGVGWDISALLHKGGGGMNCWHPPWPSLGFSSHRKGVYSPQPKDLVTEVCFLLHLKAQGRSHQWDLNRFRWASLNRWARPKCWKKLIWQLVLSTKIIGGRGQKKTSIGNVTLLNPLPVSQAQIYCQDVNKMDSTSTRKGTKIN